MRLTDITSNKTATQTVLFRILHLLCEMDFETTASLILSLPR